MQRCFRDIHAGTQHMIVSPPVLQGTGRILAGLAPAKKWLFMGVVDE